MKKRVISLLLALVMFVSLLPTPAHSTAVTEQDLEQQIRDTYRTAQRRSGRSSFNGFCGALVSWQTYLLGIDATTHGRNGKDAFDQYRYRTTTCGGYGVKAYPASAYTLKEALNAITNNGTTDAYNILVGFQKTNTTEGSIYGHAVFVHGIVDGVVYFMECYASGIGGSYWAEGAPISCSIDTFCRYYNSWTVFDGVAYFGVKTYADMCTSYPAGMTGMTNATVQLRTEPVDTGVNDADAEVTALIRKGEILRVTELLKTPGGKYWYAVCWGENTGYIPADAVIAMEPVSDDVTVENLKVPAALRKGYGFVLGGTVIAQYSQLQQIQVQVHNYAAAGDTICCEALVDTNGTQFSLNTSAIDRNMTFRKLPAGDYWISISAKVKNYVYENGEAVSQEYTVDLWNASFRVVSDWGKYYTVTFDACGGDDAADAAVVAAGAPVGSLPMPERPGYAFVGWYTQPAGGAAVTEETVITENITVYARWKETGLNHSGWMKGSSGWTYLDESGPVKGWFVWNGITFYQDIERGAADGWTQIGGKWYYLSSHGAVQTGWIEHDDHLHYLREDGARAEGWVQLDNGYYYFGENGVMHTGWLEVDGEVYYLDENGVRVNGEIELDGRKYRFQQDGTLHTGWIYKSGKHMYLDGEGNPVTGWHNINGVVCYFGSNGELYLAAAGSGNYGSLMFNGFQ